MKCMNRNVLYGLGATAVVIFFLAPSARHYLPVLATLACPLSMGAMMFGASKMGGNKTNDDNKTAASCCLPDTAPKTIASTGQTNNATNQQLLQGADLATLRARIAELESSDTTALN